MRVLRVLLLARVRIRQLCGQVGGGRREGYVTVTLSTRCIYSLYYCIYFISAQGGRAEAEEGEGGEIQADRAVHHQTRPAGPAGAGPAAGRGA